MMNRPAVGVAVIIVKKNLILLGKRLNAHGHGTWAFPGGHLEFQETIEECAKREVAEETGLIVDSIVHGAFTNDFFHKEKKHYVTLFVFAQYDTGEPKVMEPDKCEVWAWFSLDNLPHPLFLPFENLLKQGIVIPDEFL